jgi:tetratricopeptide (TPR) repeat protein
MSLGRAYPRPNRVGVPQWPAKRPSQGGVLAWARGLRPLLVISPLVSTQGSRRERVTPIRPLDGLGAGRAALARGDWQAARLAFEQSLETGENPEALEGLGLAAWWLDLGEVVFDVRERAYRSYRERDDNVGAARMAVWLAWDTAAFRGEQAIANGWLQRAHRLLTGCPDAKEHAWLALRSGSFALLDDGDPEKAEIFASEAVRIGQALGAVDYELVGLALRGFARVTAGSVVPGLQELDEVNAAVLAGEMTDWVLIALACCYLVAACERIRDHERAAQWCDRLKAFCTKRDSGRCSPCAAPSTPPFASGVAHGRRPNGS